MASLDPNLKIERKAPEVSIISDPRFSAISKTSDNEERKSRPSLIEDDSKSITFTLNKPLPLEKLCKPSAASSLGVPATPPKPADKVAFINKGSNKEQPIPYPTPVLKLPPLKFNSKNERPETPPLPLKSIPNLPLPPNKGPTKENISIVPNPNEKRPLTPLKEPAVRPLEKDQPFGMPLPVKESATFPNPPVPPPRKGNTIPLPRKENIFKLPTPTKDSFKELDSKDDHSKSSSSKFYNSLSKNALKFPSFKEDQIKDTLKSFLSKENGSQPVTSKDEESTSKKEGFNFSLLKEAKSKLLQSAQGNSSVEENGDDRRSISSKKRFSRFSMFFSDEDGESKPNTSIRDIFKLPFSKNDTEKQPQIKKEVEKQQHNPLELVSKANEAESIISTSTSTSTSKTTSASVSGSTLLPMSFSTSKAAPAPASESTLLPMSFSTSKTTAAAEAVPAPAVVTKKTIYRNHNTSKDKTTPSLLLSNTSNNVQLPILEKNTFERLLFKDDSQNLLKATEDVRSPPTPIKDTALDQKTTPKFNSLAVPSKEKAKPPVHHVLQKPNEKDKTLPQLNIKVPPSLPKEAESNTALGNKEFKPPVPKRNIFKAEMPKVVLPNQSPIEKPLPVSTKEPILSKPATPSSSSLLPSPTSASLPSQSSSKHVLKPSTKEPYKPPSKEKLPKPTLITSGLKSIVPEKDIVVSPKEGVKEAVPNKISKVNDVLPKNGASTAVIDDFRPPTPKKDISYSSPKSSIFKEKETDHSKKPNISSRREVPIPSPRAIDKEKIILPAVKPNSPLPPPPPPPRKINPPTSILDANVMKELSASNDLFRPPTPKKDLVYLSNCSTPKFSDDKSRLNKPSPLLPLIATASASSSVGFAKEKKVLKQQISTRDDIFNVPLPQANINKVTLQKPNSYTLPIPTKNSNFESSSRNVASKPPPVLPKTFLPDIAPPPPPKRNILPPPINGIPYNLARHKELLPIPETVRLSLEEDYPNRTISNPRDIFHVEYRERTHFRGAQWCFDEFSGIYHKKIPGLHQSLPNFQNLSNTEAQTNGRGHSGTKLNRSRTTVKEKKPYRTRTRLSLSRHKEPVYYSDGEDDIPQWKKPTNVNEIRLMRKRSEKLGNNKAKLELCRVLIETAYGRDMNEEFNSMVSTRVSTKYSSSDLRKKKKKDMIFDEVLVLEAQKLLKGLTIGKNGDYPNPEAQFLLANCYGMGGLGFALDREKAFSLYIHASKQNHIESTYRAGVCYESGIGTNQDYNRAMSFYRKAATYSHVPSMYKLGIILLRGYCGQTKNIREALSWLQRAASASSSENPHALYALAMLQLNEACPDTNLIADTSYAIDLLHESAKLDYAPSQVKLGELYEAGCWVEVDDALSIYWYTRAAEAGNADAALALSCWYLTGSSGILEQSDQEAFLWAYKAATNRTADRWTVAKAMFLVGLYIEKGLTSNPEHSKAWFRRAAALGHKGAVEKMKNEDDDLKAICYTD